MTRRMIVFSAVCCLGLALAAPVRAQESAPAKDGAATVTLPQERKLLAAHIGVTPESLSRAFVALRAVGVGGRGRKVTIDDVARLRAFCGADEVV